MSANLSIQNGKAEMFSGNGVVPWHGAGTIVSGLLTAAEAIETASLGWQVALEDIYTKNDGFHAVPGYWGVVRQDNHMAVGVVKSRYAPIQNVECFDFLDSLVADGKLKYETAGALRGGSLIWMAAKYDGDLTINKDKHEQWLLLVTSHDGSKPLSLQWTTVRVVCMNTLSLALGQAERDQRRARRRGGVSNRIAIRHCKEWAGKAEEARRVLGLTEDYFATMREALSGLNEQPMNEADCEVFTRLLIPAKNEKEVPTVTSNMRWGVQRLFNRPEGGTTGQSRWDALNAVTDYADHHLAMRGPNASRLESATMGTGAELKQKAFELLTGEQLTAALIAAKPHTVSMAPTAPAAHGGADDFQSLLNR